MYLVIKIDGWIKNITSIHLYLHFQRLKYWGYLCFLISVTYHSKIVFFKSELNGVQNKLITQNLVSSYDIIYYVILFDIRDDQTQLSFP